MNADLSLGRQRPPKPPHGGAVGFFIGRLAKGISVDMAWIHPLVELVDGFPLAGTVYPTDQNKNGKLACLQKIELCLEAIEQQKSGGTH